MKTHQSNTPLVQTNPPREPTKKIAAAEKEHSRPVEVGGPSGPEPTRYGDWEKAGRCSDF